MSARRDPPFIPLEFDRVAESHVLARARSHYEFLDHRRTVRHFSPDPVPRAVIEDLVRAASTAPSGAHKQPWTFVAVSSASIQHKIREAAEEEERQNYGGRMPPAWLQALEPMGTNEHKPFLEIAPWIVVLFQQDYGVNEDGSTERHYYVSESVGIAAGMFIAAVHAAGLATLTHTPSPMGFLREILGRPKNERPYLLLPVGYPAADAEVPNLVRKPIEDVMVVIDGD